MVLTRSDGTGSGITSEVASASNLVSPGLKTKNVFGGLELA